SDSLRGRQHDKDALVHLTRAEVAAVEMRLNQCLAEIRKTLRINPQCGEAYVVRAKIVAAYDRIAEALKDLDTAQKLTPRIADIYSARGNILYDSANDSLEAIRQFERAFELGLPRWLYLRPWGRAMIDAGRGEEVMQYLRDSADIDPVSPMLFETRAH